MADLVGKKLGDYRLISLIATGGLASVYLAKHITLKTVAAVKVLHKQSSDEPKDEVHKQALMTIPLAHPHVIQVVNYGVEKDIAYLVMDYAPNGTLRKRHPKGTKLPLSVILSYIRQISDALQYLHNRKLMHLDIKPENMLVGRHYEILLSDFGLTTVAPDPEVESSENIAGTIPYMAPEQFQGKPCQASDQYALGVVVYEWLCGSCPFEGSAEEIENQHLSTSPQPLRERVSGISPLVEFVILTALAKDPLDRFASVQAFANALERAYIAESVAAPWGAAPWGVGQGSWGTVPSIGQRTVSSIGQRSIAHAQQPQDSPAVITGEITVIASSPRHRWMGDLNKYSSDERQASVSSPPLLASQYTPNPEQASVPFPTLSIPKDFPGEEKGIADEFHLSLFAFARATLEKDDGAFVNKTYSLQAGISQNKPADFDGEPFDLTVSDHAKSLTFDILVHESENIELSTKWHKRLRYDPRIEEPQFVEFTFQVIESGHSSLIVDFYHERRWLRTIRIEFESIEESQFIVSSAEV